MWFRRRFGWWFRSRGDRGFCFVIALNQEQQQRQLQKQGQRLWLVEGVRPTLRKVREGWGTRRECPSLRMTPLWGWAGGKAWANATAESNATADSSAAL